MSSCCIKHQYQDLITIFNNNFVPSFNTKLVKGEDEPLYLPAGGHCRYHQIIFAHGYYASALHEIAHWCIAGQARRLLEDFGYWYQPDGRNAQEQQAFEVVEIKPQALEWAFCVAANKSFDVSVDNLEGVATDRYAFKKLVHQQVIRYLEIGFPERGEIFIKALANYYQTPFPLTASAFI